MGRCQPGPGGAGSRTGDEQGAQDRDDAPQIRAGARPRRRGDPADARIVQGQAAGRDDRPRCEALHTKRVAGGSGAHHRVRGAAEPAARRGAEPPARSEGRRRPRRVAAAVQRLCQPGAPEPEGGALPPHLRRRSFHPAGPGDPASLRHLGERRGERKSPREAGVRSASPSATVRLGTPACSILINPRPGTRARCNSSPSSIRWLRRSGKGRRTHPGQLRRGWRSPGRRFAPWASCMERRRTTRRFCTAT